MDVIDVNIVENTLDTWLTRKQGELPAFEEQLINALGKAFVEETSPFVPYEKGYLEASAESVWFFEPALHHWGLTIVWTGMLNPSREGHSDFVGDDGENLDYALFQYYAPLRHPIKGTDHWVEEGMEVFDWKRFAQTYLEWLSK